MSQFKSSGLTKAMLQGTVNEKRRGRREEVDKRSGGKTILKSGQGWT